MLKKNREVTDFNEICDIVRRCNTVRLGINGDDYPYVVPLSFGYEASESKLTIFIHSAKNGLKLSMLSDSVTACIEGDIFHGYVETAYGITSHYESFIGFGDGVEIYDEEKAKGLKLILSHCGYSAYEFTDGCVEATRVFKFVVNKLTGKRNLP